jgi:hypothetical protein
MAGTPEREEHGIPRRIREVMVQFDVDENKRVCFSAAARSLLRSLSRSGKGILGKYRFEKPRQSWSWLRRHRKVMPRRLRKQKRNLKKS